MQDKPKVLISILAHGGAQAAFDRHLPYWKELKTDNPNAELMIWMPDNDVLTKAYSYGIPVQAVGAAEHNGQTAIRRIQYMFEFMAGTGHDLYVFFEYDSFCLGPLPPFNADVAANVFTDVESEKFKGGMYFHPPVILTNNGMQVLARQMVTMAPTEEGGMWDRFMGLAAKQTGLTVHNFLQNGEGFARNTIHAQDQAALREAILKGAKMIHGIKDEASLKIVQRAWELRNMQNRLEAEGYTVTLP